MGVDHAVRGDHRGGRHREPPLHRLLPLHQVRTLYIIKYLVYDIVYIIYMLLIYIYNGDIYELYTYYTNSVYVYFTSF